MQAVFIDLSFEILAKMSAPAAANTQFDAATKVRYLGIKRLSKEARARTGGRVSKGFADI